MTNSSTGQARVSVNLDIANLPPEAPAYIIREAAAYGRIVIARAFADYRRNDLGDLPVQLFQYGFQLIHCPSWPNGGGRLKSVVDSILAQDLRDQAEDDPTLEIFILGSGDRDFMAAVHALRRHGRKVIIAATPDSSNRMLVAGADGYIALPMADRPDRLDRFDRTERYERFDRTERFDRSERFERVAPPVARPIAPPLPPIHAVTPPPPVQTQPVTTPIASAPPSAPVAAPTTPAPTATTTAPVPAAEPEVRERPHPYQVEGPLTMAALTEQIVALVNGRPQITPRQVLQVLAPRNESGSARRRQAVGDAIAMLLQQGKLIRKPEMVRGRMAEVLAFRAEEQAPMVAQAGPPPTLETLLPELFEAPEEPAPTPVQPPPVRAARPPFRSRRGATGSFTARNGRDAAAAPAPMDDRVSGIEAAPVALEPEAPVPQSEPEAPRNMTAAVEPEATELAEAEPAAKSRRRPRRRTRAGNGAASDESGAGERDGAASPVSADGL